MKILKGKQLAALLGIKPASLSISAQKGYLVKQKYPVAEWAKRADNGRLIHYQVPDEAYRELAGKPGGPDETARPTDRNGGGPHAAGKRPPRKELGVAEQVEAFMGRYYAIVEIEAEGYISHEKMTALHGEISYECFGFSGEPEQILSDREPDPADDDWHQWAAFDKAIVDANHSGERIDETSWKGLVAFLIKRRHKMRPKEGNNDDADLTAIDSYLQDVTGGEYIP
jgi:hypothetical protein